MLKVQGKKELPGFKKMRERKYGGNRVCRRVVHNEDFLAVLHFLFIWKKGREGYRGRSMELLGILLQIIISYMWSNVGWGV